ncbi:unnamed protein product [Kuraishia capsulata CBS 1993]|uniref:Transcription initiation factor IIB n=1 Tax=Kuraishia capsulata CBS 1993 TaxID=1382522 RepID=W6MKF4_9ASCO|nr:uncharacterized protein KUCA_T00002815001 [Kuraishia capsulata CBS 1993]CDK26841.1 unnamed protein product [Kuraishia capsulata CBS 1993]
MTADVASDADDRRRFNGVNLNITLVCPECKVYPPELIERFSEGDVVCALCGLVLSNRIVDTRSEWRTFSNDDQNGDDPSRVGEASSSLLDSDQLSTVISSSQEAGRTGRELNRAQSKSLVDKKDNALQDAYSKITHMCDGYQLPKVVQDGAKEVYKLVYDERALKGKSQLSIIAASIVLGCRNAKVARSFKEIWALTNVPRKEIGKVFKMITKIVQEKSAQSGASLSFQSDSLAARQMNAEDLVGRFCSHLGLSPQVSSAAEFIARRTREVGVLAGRSPTTIAAAVVYMAAQIFGQSLLPSRISEKTGVSDGTIKTSYKLLYAKKEDLVDPYWIESGRVNFDKIPKA